jgi:WD40 repeat protein
VQTIPFGSRILHLSFSADGTRLALGFKGLGVSGVRPGAQGVRVIDLRSQREVLVDSDYEDDVRGLAFAPDGGLITSSAGGQLRRYGPDLKLIVKREAPDGREPTGVAIDPSGRLVAVGYFEERPVSILDAKTLAPLAKAQTSDLTYGDFENVAWSREGATLMAGGHGLKHFQGQWRSLLRRFDTRGRRIGEDAIAGEADAISDIQPCGRGFAFGSAAPTFGLLSGDAGAQTLQGPRTADMLFKRASAFALSPDAASTRFGLGNGEEQPVLFDLAAASLTDSPSQTPKFLTAKVAGLPVTDWEDTSEAKFKGAKLTEDHEFSHALAIRPDASGFALGTEWWVRAYDAQGKERWKEAGPSVAFGVNFSADGDILAVAHGDGTIRWLRWSDGEELLAFFVEPQTRKWVAWTPSGYYMASAGGEDLIGWHVNRGWEQEADFFPASQFRAQYNRPDIVRLMLQTKDEAEAIRQANKTSERSVPAMSVAAALPPVVTFASPPDGSHFSGDSVEIAYSLRSSTGQPIDRLDVLVDGRLNRTIGFEKAGPREAEGSATVTLPAQDATVSLIARSGDLTSAPVSVTLVYDGPKSIDMSDRRPKLYALLVGVTRYKKPEYDTLKFPAHDAEELAKALEAQKGGLYSDVQVRIIDDPTRPDADPTQPNVFDGLEWLKHSTTDHDLSIVFLAGHGFQETKDRFWFLTREGDTDRLRATAIFKNDLLDYISALPGKKILLLDACHAGSALSADARAVESIDMNILVNDFSTVGAGVVDLRRRVVGAIAGGWLARGLGLSGRQRRARGL